jgi:ketosteroid isomerase-like protein
MSQENVERARQGYKHFNEVGQFDSAFLSPECEFDWSGALPEVPPFKGLDRANVALREWLAAFDDFSVGVDRFIDVGDDRLVVFVRNIGKLKGTEAPIENRFVHVFTFRDGQGVRMAGYLDEERALEAAGLSEQAMSQENAETAHRPV